MTALLRHPEWPKAMKDLLVLRPADGDSSRLSALRNDSPLLVIPSLPRDLLVQGTMDGDSSPSARNESGVSALRNDSRVVKSLLPLLLLLAACVSGPETLEKRTALADKIAAGADMHPFRIKGGRFTLRGFKRIADMHGTTARLYIEGDGQAWRSTSRPSVNPTPSDPVGLRLAAADRSRTVIYLARPCQYTKRWARHNCPQKFWTSHRFSMAVIESYMAALDTFKTRHDIQHFRLTGYSGGGAVAAILAAKRDDITRLRTVAGNLDTKQVNAHHGVDPMPESLNPANYAGKLASIPQIHYSGAEDEVVPPKIAKGFIAALPAPSCARHRVIDGATHHNIARYWPYPGGKDC